MHESDQHMLSRMMDGEWDDGLDPSRCAAIVSNDAVARARWARYHMIRDVLNNEPVRIDTDLALRVRSAIDQEPAYSNVARLQGASEGRFVGPDGGPDDGYEAGASPEGVGAPVATSTAPDGKTPVAGAKPSSDARPWGRALAGLAVAASMALVTVVGLNVLESGNDDPAGFSQVADARNPSSDAGAQAVGNREATAPAGNLRDAVLPEVEYVANRSSHWVTGDQERRASREARLNMFLSQHIENSPAAERQGMLPYSRLVGYDELPDR